MAEKDEHETLEFTEQNSQDEFELEEQEETLSDKLKSLRSKLQHCENEKSQYLEDLQRAKAEFLNTKKRLSEQLLIEKERITNKHISELLPLCDSFDMATMNKEVWQSVDESWRKGVEAIQNKLLAILQSYGVEAVSPIGESFDPTMHEAMSTVDSDTHESDTVIEVLQKGYKRNGEIIRPAKVIIAK